MKYKVGSQNFKALSVQKYKTKTNEIRDLSDNNAGGISGGLAYAAANVGIGAAGIVEGVTDLVSAAGYALTGQTDRAKAQFLDSWSGDWKRQLDDWYNPNAVMSFVGDVGQGVGNSLIAAIPYAGLPAFFVGAAGGGISSAAEKTGDVGLKEIGYGLTSGIIEGMLEKYVGPGAASVKGIGTKALSSLTKNTAKSAVRNSVVKQMLSNMGEEFLEESLSEMIDPLMQRLYQIDPTAATSFPDVIRAGIIGGISGGILGGAQIGLGAAHDSSVGRTIAANGNSATIKHTAEAMMSSPFFTDQNGIKDEGILELAGTLNSYNELTPDKLASGEGYRLLGAMKRQIFSIEARTKSAPYRRELEAQAEKTAAYATKFYGKTYTAEDIKADKDGILTHLTVLRWAGDAEVQARAAASVNATRAEAMAKGGLTNNVQYQTAAEMEAEENGTDTATAEATAETVETVETPVSEVSANSQAIENLVEENGAVAEAASENATENGEQNAPKKITKYNAKERLDEAKAARASARAELDAVSKMAEGTAKARAAEAARAKLTAAEAEISEAKRLITERYTEQTDKKEASKAGRENRKTQKSTKSAETASEKKLTVEEASRMSTEALNERYDELSERKNELVREYTAETDEERRREINRAIKKLQGDMVTINTALRGRGSERYNVDGEADADEVGAEEVGESYENASEIEEDTEKADGIRDAILGENSGSTEMNAEDIGGNADYAEKNDENAGTDEGDGDLIKPDARTERMLGSYDPSVVEKARKLLPDFDLLSFERKVAVCELIDTSPNMGRNELRAMCVLVAGRDGLFAYSSPTKHRGVHKVLAGMKDRRLIVLSNNENVISGEGKGNVVGETVFHEIVHDIKALDENAFMRLAKVAFKYVTPKMVTEIQDRYTEHFTGTKFSEWAAKKENEGKGLSDFIVEHPSKLTADIVAEEVVAGYIGKAFADTRYVKYLGDTSPKTFKWVAKTFNTLFRCLFGKNRFAERALIDVYGHFTNALAETQVKDIWNKSTVIYQRYDEDEDMILPSEGVEKLNLAAVAKHKQTLQEKYTNSASVPIETLMERYDAIVKIWEELSGELDSEFLRQWNAKGKDKAFTVFKAQAGYKYNIELSSMCKKGVPLFEAIDTIVRKEVLAKTNDPVLDKRAKEILYDILKSKGFEIPCAICYVEQARQREGVTIRDFLQGIQSKDKLKIGWNTLLGEVEQEMAKAGVEYHFPKLDRSVSGEAYTPAANAMTEAEQKAYYDAMKKLLNREIKRYNEAEKKSRPTLKAITAEEIKRCLGGTLPANLKLFKVLLSEPNSRFTIDGDLLYSSVTTHNLAAYHTQLYSLFNAQGGVSGYKTKQQPIAYWGELLGKNWKLSTVRESGGIRNQSNSDGQMYTLLDLAQMYIDATAKGFYIQAYTKVLAELRLFGLSRAKINASLIPRVRTVYNPDGTVNYERTQENAGLDANGEPIYDDFEGIPHEEAFDILSDPEYSKSVGGVCIGYSDNHILKLLDDGRIQLIIGFHDKTDNPDKRYRGARFAKNYNGLNEAVNAKGETVHIGFNQFVIKAEKMFKKGKNGSFSGTADLNGKTYEPNDIPRLAADLYLEHCAEKGYRPAYSGIDGSTDFSKHENYYKLLADFSLYDSTGAYAPHQRVEFMLPDTVPVRGEDGAVTRMKSKEYIKKELQKELAVRDGIAAALADESEDGVIAQFERGMREAEGDDAERLSLEDSEYLSAVKNGDMETAQRMVDEAAKRAGYTVKAYHGTPNGGFTVFGGTKTRNGAPPAGSYWFSVTEKHAREGYAHYVEWGKRAENPMVYSTWLMLGRNVDIGNGRVEALDYERDGNGAPSEDLKRVAAAITRSKLYYADEMEYRKKYAQNLLALTKIARDIYADFVWQVTETKEFAELCKNNHIDSVTAYEEGEREADGSRPMVKTFGVFYPEQIKSADPVTYDDDGKVIPLSERFDSGEEDIRYSLDEVTRNDKIAEDFVNRFDKWDGKTIGFSFVVGETSEALQKAQIPKKQIRFDASKLVALLNKHSGMTRPIIRKIPILLKYPILVIDSKQNPDSKIVLGDLKDGNGKLVTIVLLLKPTSKKGKALDIIKISSAEGRSHIQSLFKYGDDKSITIRYVDKKRIQSWLNVNGLQLPLHNLDLDSNQIISQDDDGVNSFAQNNSENSSADDTERLSVDTNNIEVVKKHVLGNGTVEQLKRELKDRGVSADAAGKAADAIVKKHYRKVIDVQPSATDFKRAVLHSFVLWASAENSSVRFARTRDGKVYTRGDKQNAIRHFKVFDAHNSLLSELLPQYEVDESLWATVRSAQAEIEMRWNSQDATKAVQTYKELRELYPTVFTASAEDVDADSATEIIRKIRGMKHDDLASKLSAEQIKAAREAFAADIKAYATELSSALGMADKELQEERRIHGYKESLMGTVRDLREMLKNKRIGAQEADALVMKLIDRITKTNSEASGIGDRSYVEVRDEAIAENLAEIEEIINGLLHDIDEAEVLNETELSQEGERTVFEQYVRKDLIDEIRVCATRVAAKKGERITADEYELIARMMMGIKQWYHDYDMVWFEGRMRSRMEVINEWLSNSYGIVRKKPEDGKKTGVKNFLKSRFKEVMKCAAVGLLDTHAVWAIFDGYRANGLFTRLWDQLEQAMSEQAIMKEQILAERDAFFRKHKDFELELKTRKVKYQNHEITLGEAITLLMTAKREQAFLALYGSDLTVLSDPTFHFKGKGFEGASEEHMRSDIKLRMAELKEAIGGGAAVLEYISIAERFFNETSKSVKRKADESYFGYTNVEEGYYIPITRDKTAFSPDMLSAGGQIDQFISLTSLPFNKHTIKNAKAALVIGNINDLISRHADGLSKYATMYQPVNAVNRILGRQIVVKPDLKSGRTIWLMEKGDSGSPNSIMKILTDSLWEGDAEKAKKYFRNLLNATQCFSQKQYNAAQKLVDYIVKNATVNALGLNIKSVMSQLSAIPIAGYAVSAPNLLKGLSSIAGKIRDLKAEAELMDKYSVQAHSRNIDSTGIRSGALIDKMGHSAIKGVNTLNKLTEATMAPISATDRFTFLVVWEAAQHQAESAGYAIGTEENLKMAGKIVDEFAKMTQPTVSAANSVAARTDNLLAKTFMRFTSATNKMFSRMVESIGRYLTLKDAKRNKLADISDKEIAEASSQARRMGGAIVASNIMLVGLIQLFKFAFAKDRDDDETVAEDILGDTMDSFVGMVPVLSQVYGFFKDGYEISDLSFDAINDTLKALQDTGKIFTAKVTGEVVEPTAVARVLRNGVYNLGAMFGIPVRNTWNNVTGLIKRVSPTAGANINAIFYDPTSADLAIALSSGDEQLAETVANLMLARRGGKVDYTAAQEFLSLYNAPNDEGELDIYGVMPRRAKADISVDGKSYVLNAKQYKTFKQVYGGVATAVSELIAREDYKSLSEEGRAKAIKSLYSLYYSKATTAALGTAPAKSEVISSFVSDTTGYVSALAYASGISGDDRKDKILAYLKKAGLDANDQTWVLATLGYKAEKEKAIQQVRRSKLTAEEKANAYAKLGIKDAA